ncbi:MAG: S8 family serine peptidase [Alphaproteobacteria bacterium]|nr:S8 family serine peptidase [Alphaproteobacteria bacterium]
MSAAAYSAPASPAGKGQIRQYVVLKATPDLLKIYDSGAFDEIRNYLVRAIGIGQIDAAFKQDAIRVAVLPSRKWKLWRSGLAPELPPVDGLIVVLTFASDEVRAQFHALVGMAPPKAIVNIGADLAFAPTQFWCPGEGGQSLFATRAEAELLMHAAYLKKKGRRGQGVNVIVVDQGFDESLVPNFGGRWHNAPPPPQGWGSEHGNRILRNIRSIAPDATFWDLPLIPTAITDIPQFVSDAQASFETVRHDIARLRRQHQVRGPWVMVNAWGIFDRRSETPTHRYTDNLHHPFNDEVARFDAAGVDVIFAAGNCGQFCPHPRCGNGDRGPGNSILGANAHPQVLTVGAVTNDCLWLGYSSQGPGPGDLSPDKPDLCAPSQFAEIADARAGNTGTSTASALAAGVVAAMRSKWNAAAIAPAALRSILRDNPRAIDGIALPDHRFGHGILDARKAYRAARARHP